MPIPTIRQNVSNEKNYWAALEEAKAIVKQLSDKTEKNSKYESTLLPFSKSIQTILTHPHNILVNLININDLAAGKISKSHTAKENLTEKYGAGTKQKIGTAGPISANYELEKETGYRYPREDEEITNLGDFQPRATQTGKHSGNKEIFLLGGKANLFHKQPAETPRRKRANADADKHENPRLETPRGK